MTQRLEFANKHGNATLFAVFKGRKEKYIPNERKEKSRQRKTKYMKDPKGSRNQ